MQQPFGRAADDELRKPSASKRAHDDEVDGLVGTKLLERLRGGALDQARRDTLETGSGCKLVQRRLARALERPLCIVERKLRTG